METASDLKRRRYSSRVFAAAFGRYEAGRAAGHPASEVLVGRERERARILDWLLAHGSRGAYLVTGYRGVGKTSFINFSLQRYAEDVYGRYLQARVGRALFWDGILVAVVIATALLIPLLAGQLAATLRTFAFQNLEATSRAARLLCMLLLAPLLLIACYPLVYSRRLLRTAAGVSRTARRDVALLSVACFVVLHQGAFASPVVGMALFTSLLSWTFFVARAFSVTVETRLDRDPASEGFSRTTSAARRLSDIVLVLGGGVLLVVPRFLMVPGKAPPDETCLTKTYLATTGAFAILGFFVRSADAWHLTRFLTRTLPTQKRLADAQGRVAVTNLSLGIAGSAALWLTNRESPARLLILVAVASMLAALAFAVRQNMRLWRDPYGVQPVWFGFHPRPRALIGLKGVFAFALGLQLLQPVVREYVVRVATWLNPVVEQLLGKAAAPWLMEPPDYSMFGRFSYALGTRAVHNASWSSQFRTISSPVDEICWLMIAVAFVLGLMYLENDWIVRRHDRARRDDAYDPERWRAPASAGGPPQQFGGADSRMELLHLNRELIKATSFFWIYQTWLPLLTVKVNLGFDNLSHTQVITAMLVGLRNEYYRTFISWKSRLGLLFRCTTFVVVLIISMVIGSWLAQTTSLTPHDSAWLHILAGRKSLPDDRCAGGQGCTHLLSYLLSYSDATIPIYGYQVLALLILTAALFGVARRAHGFHFMSTYSRLNAVLASLSSNVRVKNVSPRASVARWNMTFASAESSSEQETPRQDPRTIEQAFLDVLRDVLTPHVPLPISGHLLSLPAAQLTFIFDELDKIGTASSNMLDDAPSPHDATQLSAWAAPSADRERSRRVHRLLADMKNLLSVAPARFIFVGGRDLHDEWLADRSARQPLLSNIFDAEIYLPTLLIDTAGEREHTGDLSASVHVLLNARLARNQQLHELWEKRKRRLLLFPVGPADHFFVQTPNLKGPFSTSGPAPSGAKPRHSISDLSVLGLHDAHDASVPAVAWSADFLQTFAEYLAFRSRGNPKRVDALLEALVRPSGRVLRDPILRWSSFDCQHVLRFGHPQRIYIQFVAEIYRRLSGLVAVRAMHGDDKNVRAAFYLADYLMKFHRRAFSWTSLERIDEVLHMHRAPDLRTLLSELVLDWSQSFVQPIVNGMYTFRFRSDVAAEIRYISRLSESEMAALNFTLDESQSIKIELQRRADRLVQRGKHEALAETRAALGELYDFDEDYEEARGHYAAAIELLDEQIKRAEEKGLRPQSRDTAKRPVPLRRHAEWGALRLRLMLQIGLTYERSRNYEQALAEYRNALTLSRALWFDMLDAYARDDEAVHGSADKGAAHNVQHRPEQVVGSHRIDTLKHLHIVYQPLFAVAWMGEKAPSGIDTSLTAIEEGLWEIRQRLPFVRLKGVRLTENPVRAAHANFALTTADLHHNAGNLYFFKGRHTQDGRPTRGYLDRAYYHYAVALHEVRRSHSHRRESARFKLVPFDTEAFRSGSPIPGDILPEAALRRVTCAIFGLTNVWFAQLSLEGLIWQSCESRKSPGCAEHLNGWIADLEQTFMHWLSTPPQPADKPEARRTRVSTAPAPWLAIRPPARTERAAEQERASEFERAIGVWMWTDPGRPRARSQPLESRPAQETRVVRLEGLDRDIDRLIAFVRFSELAARLLFTGGHSEEAANEWIRLAGSLEVLLTALQTYAALDTRRDEAGTDASHEVCAFLVEHAKIALEQADACIAFKVGARTPRFELLVSAHAKRLVRAIGLAAVRQRQKASRHESYLGCNAMQALDVLSELARRWVVFAKRADEERERGDLELYRPHSPNEIAARFRGELEANLECSAYPVLNHLMCQRVLIFDRVLGDPHRASEGSWRSDDEALRLVAAMAEELSAMTHEFNAEWHFTPFHAGTALALCALACEASARTPLRLEAERQLIRSQHTYTSRAAYYEVITHMYYLDDDFNDRSTQVGHAMQMMGSDLTGLLLSYLREPRDRLRVRPTSTAPSPHGSERRRGLPRGTTVAG